MRIALSRWVLLGGLLVGGCVAVSSPSVSDRQAVYGYDAQCIVADSQARAVYTTTGSLQQRIYDECLAPPVSTTEVPKGYQGFRYHAGS
jgi:hypothetical protein